MVLGKWDVERGRLSFQFQEGRLGTKSGSGLRQPSERENQLPGG